MCRACPPSEPMPTSLVWIFTALIGTATAWAVIDTCLTNASQILDGRLNALTSFSVPTLGARETGLLTLLNHGVVGSSFGRLEPMPAILRPLRIFEFHGSSLM
jgi:hypothetical protein